MIVWINGAFGAGKSTVAKLLADTVPGMRLFDPEYVGFLLREFVDVPTGDFQDLPLWRSLTVQTLVGLARAYDHPWVVPMTLLNPAYRAELLGGLRMTGLTVQQAVLRVPEAELRSRIDGDETLTTARGWRHRHVSAALAELAGLAEREADTREFDAFGPASRVAAEIRSWLTVPTRA